MRNFSAAVQSAMSQSHVDFFVLIELQFSNTYRFSSLPHDVVYDGNLYVADGGVFEYEPPQNSTVVDREAYKIAISDVSATMKAEIEANVVGKPVTVYGGVLDSNGDPLLSTDDVFLVYKGKVDAPSISNDFDKVLAVFEGTSPMSDLDFVRTLITSKDGMDQFSATDTSFDEIFDDQEIELKWGKL